MRVPFASDPSDQRTMRLVGAIALAVGFLAAGDSAYDLYRNGSTRPASVFEFLLAQGAIVAGVALLQHRRRAFEIAALAAAAGFLHSAVALGQLGPKLVALVTVLGMSDQWTEYGLRLILMTTQVLFWPVLLGHLYIDLQCRNPEDAATRTGKRAFWACAGAAIAFTVAVELFLSEIPGVS